MKHTPWLRAATRALIVVAGLLFGLTVGAVSFAGAADTTTPAAQAYARAAQKGYETSDARPAAPSRGPVTHIAPDQSKRAPLSPNEQPAEGPAQTPGWTPGKGPAHKPDPEIARSGVGPRAGALGCLTAAIYYEARGEAPAGRAAVAQVVLNRTRKSGFPKTVCGVVYQGAKAGRCQFSFACNGAMDGRRDLAAWRDASRVALRALDGYVMATVGKATCFHAVRAGRTAVADRGVRLGRHWFSAS